jgi:hypothetical protein
VRLNNRRSLALLLCALCALLAVAFVGTSAAAKKKSHKVNMLGKGGQVGVKLNSTYKGSPFGTCKMTGTLVIPNTTQHWKCKAGKFTLTGFGKTGAANDSKGTWKIKKGSGTGKYKGITGGGTFAGKLSTGVYRYKGTVRY